MRFLDTQLRLTPASSSESQIARVQHLQTSARSTGQVHGKSYRDYISTLNSAVRRGLRSLKLLLELTSR